MHLKHSKTESLDLITVWLSAFNVLLLILLANLSIFRLIKAFVNLSSEPCLHVTHTERFFVSMMYARNFVFCDEIFLPPKVCLKKQKYARCTKFFCSRKQSLSFDCIIHSVGLRLKYLS